MRSKLVPRKKTTDIKGHHYFLQFIVAFAVKVRVLPRKLDINTVIEQRERDVKITNLGNVSVKLFDVKQCPRSGKCKRLNIKAIRLYPGKTWRIKVPGTGKVKIDQSIAGNVTTITAN